MKKSVKIISSFYPEHNVGGYTSVDGTVEFYGRINSLIDDSMQVLDFGAGRAEWYENQTCPFRKEIRKMKGKVKKVVGCDIDDAIFKNDSVDEKVLIKIGEELPFENESFDIIISDYTFEHASNPNEMAKEFHRILKSGGWICARTPNKYSYISILTRMIKNSYHVKLLKYVQPERKQEDVFPTTFKLNSITDVTNYFNKDNFDNYTYRYEAEPSYYFNNKFMFFMFYFINACLPPIMKSNLFVFLRKK